MGKFLDIDVDTSDIKDLDKSIVRGLIKGITGGSAHLTSQVQNKHLRGGTTSTRLGVRSGKMRSETRAVRTRIEGTKVKGGFKIDVFYASTHFGPRGKTTTIKPTRSQWLTIPLPPALTAGGRPKKTSARQWGDRLKFIPRGSKPPLLAEVNRGSITPFYVLKKEVTIPTRIHPEDIERENIAALSRIVDNSIQKEFNKL